MGPASIVRAKSPRPRTRRLGDPRRPQTPHLPAGADGIAGALEAVPEASDVCPRLTCQSRPAVLLAECKSVKPATWG